METRNRKPLVRPSIGDEVWELRFGPENMFRVYCRAHLSEGEVHILAVGVKRGAGSEIKSLVLERVQSSPEITA